MRYYYKDCLQYAQNEKYNNEKYCYFLFCHLAGALDYLDDDKMQDYKDKLSRLRQGAPLDLVIGYTQFMGLNFPFSMHCLTPRQETEVITDRLIKYINAQNKKCRVLDLCTGSGCIGISIAKHTKAHVVLSDVSEPALNCARDNAKLFRVNNVEFVVGDMFENIAGEFDIIVCNPPYITDDEYDSLEIQVRNYDPKIALVGGESGLKYYKVLADQSSKYLQKDGIIVCEIGAGQGKSVKNLFAKHFKYITIQLDYSGNDRMVVATNKEGICLPN